MHNHIINQYLIFYFHNLKYFISIIFNEQVIIIFKYNPTKLNYFFIHQDYNYHKGKYILTYYILYKL